MVPGVLIKKSTKSTVYFGTYPKSDMLPFEPQDIDPDYEWLIEYVPFTEPSYDPRIYLIVTNVPDVNFYELFEEHPLYPGLKAYTITYSLEKRSNEEIIYSIENAQRQANDMVWLDTIHKEETVYMLSALLKLNSGFALTPNEQLWANKISELNMKLSKNIDNRNVLVAQVMANQEPNIDSGWESA